MAQFDILTKDDLEQFKSELLAEIRKFHPPQSNDNKKWLRSSAVRELLGISPGTLQNLRVNGTLRYTKVGSILFYRYEDIQCLLDQNDS